MVAEGATTTIGVAGGSTTRGARGTTGEVDMVEVVVREWPREGLEMEEVITMEEGLVVDTTEEGEVMEDRMEVRTEVDMDRVEVEVMEDRGDSETEEDTTETRGKVDEEVWVEAIEWDRGVEDMPLP